MRGAGDIRDDVFTGIPRRVLQPPVEPVVETRQRTRHHLTVSKFD
jgi:hypothetical protein